MPEARIEAEQSADGEVVGYRLTSKGRKLLELLEAGVSFEDAHRYLQGMPLQEDDDVSSDAPAEGG